MRDYPIIGCHCSMKAPDYLVGTLKEALSSSANALMFYTSSPQSSIRVSLDKLKIEEFKQELKKSGMKINNVIVHAPYIINLANPDKLTFASSFFKEELERVSKIGAKYVVLHPGSNLYHNLGIKTLIASLNVIFKNSPNVVTLIETMAGKGNEIGSNINEIKQIIDGINDKSKIGICLDTCHLNDSGVDLSKWEDYKKQLKDLGLFDLVKCIHLNDSLNVIGQHKDRHANIGKGTIGLKVLKMIANDNDFKEVPKILETPQSEADIYKKEIKLLTT